MSWLFKYSYFEAKRKKLWGWLLPWVTKAASWNVTGILQLNRRVKDRNKALLWQEGFIDHPFKGFWIWQRNFKHSPVWGILSICISEALFGCQVWPVGPRRHYLSYIGFSTSSLTVFSGLGMCLPLYQGRNIQPIKSNYICFPTKLYITFPSCERNGPSWVLSIWLLQT